MERILIEFMRILGCCNRKILTRPESYFSENDFPTIYNKKKSIIMVDIKNDGIVIFSREKKIIFNSVGEIDLTPGKVRKHTKSRAVIHPVFDEMKECNDSSYWDDLLTKFSRGIFHRNFKYYNDTLHYKSKKKNSKRDFYVDKENPKETLEGLKEFLEDKGFVSTIERGEKLLSSYIENEENVYEKWKDFGNNQTFLVEEYIERLSSRYDLSGKQKIELESIIRLGMASDIFNNDSIKISNNKIKNIKYLEWDEDEQKFYIDYSSAKIKFTTAKRSVSSKMKEKYSSHTFSGDTFLIKNVENNAKVSDKWKHFLSDHYK